MIGVDLGMVNVGNKKHSCFICLRDSIARTEHRFEKDEPLWGSLVPKKLNMINDPPVPKERIT